MAELINFLKMTKPKNKIEAIRNSRNLSRVYVASKLGITSTMLGYLESGKRQLTEKYITNLSTVLNCSKAQILGDELDDSINYNIKDKYIQDTNEIISEIDHEGKLTDEGRAILFRKIYKLVHDFNELVDGKKEFLSHIKKVLQTNDSQ